MKKGSIKHWLLSSDDYLLLDIQTVRSQLIDRGLILYALLFPIALALSLSRVYEHGWNSVYILHILLSAGIVFTTVFRKRMPYVVRAFTFLGVLPILGTAGLFSFGLLGGGIILLLIFVICTAMIFGIRAGLFACAYSLVMMAVAGIAICTGQMAFTFDIERYATSVTGWMIMVSTFTLFASMTVCALGLLNNHLQQSLEVLHEHNDKYERLLENLVGTFIYRHDPEGYFQFISASVFRVLGYSPEEFLTHFSTYLTDHPINNAVAAYTEKSIQGIQQPPYEVQIYHKDGHICWLEVSETPVRDEHGAVIAVEGVAYDITRRKAIEEAVSRAKQEWERTFDVVPDLIAILDNDYHLVRVNLAMAHHLEKPPEQCVGLSNTYPFHTLADGTEQPCLLLDEQIHEEAEVYQEAPDDFFIITATPLFNEEGARVGSVHVAHDISERKLLEEQLRQSQKMEAIGQLAGGIAHDFNNLLQVISGFTDLAIEESEDDSQVNEELREILTATERATALVRQLLAFSRRQVLNLEALDLNQVIESISKMISRFIGADIAYTVQGATDLKPIHADRGQIEQILINLCLNARDAMPEGGTLTIETKNVRFDEKFCRGNSWAEPGNYAMLSVTDTGQGMDVQTQQRIFEPFFSTKETGKGTGLGLSMVYGIVRQHKGMTHVYSEMGHGSSFRIYLPVSESGEAAQDIVKHAPATGGNETILLAEDDATVRTLAKRVLEKAGYTLLTAVDGKEAMAIFDAHTAEIDCAILDVVMPHESGRAVYDHIMQTHPELPTLFASGYSPNAFQTNFVLEEGMHFIQKPYQRDTLLRKVREILDGS